MEFCFRRNNYRILSLGVAYVLCAPLATALRFQWGWYVHTVGFTVPWVLPTAVILRTYGALYGAQQRFSVTGDFWGDVSEETDYIFTKCRLVYIINFVDLWSK